MALGMHLWMTSTSAFALVCEVAWDAQQTIHDIIITNLFSITKGKSCGKRKGRTEKGRLKVLD